MSDDLLDGAFYEPTGDPGVFIATPRTRSLWTPDQQHGGPPSALLTRAIELTPTSIAGPSQLVRITVEILGPVPTGPVEVSAAVTRPGRSVELVEASLRAAGRAALRARAWRIRTAEVSLPEHAVSAATAPPPIPAEPSTFTDPGMTTGYLGVVDFRFTSGHFEVPGPSAAWIRPTVELVAGEKISPTQRLMAVADCGNGMSSLLPLDGWWYINPELTVHLHRVPLGEWVYVDARTTLDPSGVGLAETLIADVAGPVGVGAQSLLVGPR